MLLVLSVVLTLPGCTVMQTLYPRLLKACQLPVSAVAAVPLPCGNAFMLTAE